MSSSSSNGRTTQQLHVAAAAEQQQQSSGSSSISRTPLNLEGAVILKILYFLFHFYFLASGQAVVTGVVPFPPR